jgi:hypothetical protein
VEIKEGRMTMNYYTKYLIVLTGVSWSTIQVGQVATTVTQPIGILARTYEPTGPLPFPIQPPPPLHQPYPTPTTPIGEVNYICAQWDPDEYIYTAPFDIRYPATQIVLTQPQHFVRLLVTPQSSSNGAWIMRSEYVRGRTPEELKDIFALAGNPLEIVSVTMPASTESKKYALWTGIAGPIRHQPDFDWGDGGSVQNRLISDFNGTTYFPGYNYTSADTRYHRQPIGDVALSYRPLAGNGNACCVARYLDNFIPPAYSDLEDMYTKLDDLNYIGNGPCPLRQALNQLSPARYDTIPYVALRNDIMIGNAILEWQLFKQWESYWHDSCTCERAVCHKKPTLWIKALGQHNHETCVDRFANFGYGSGGLLACADWCIHNHLNVGINLAAIGNTFHWFDRQGRGKMGEALIGCYASYFPSAFFIDALLQGGFRNSSSCRSISFSDVCRAADSRHHGENVNLQMQAGVNVTHDLIPYVRASYFYTREHGFQEQGADSLNLTVCPYTTKTARVQVGAEINHAFESACYTAMPQIQLAWSKDFFVKKRLIKANIAQLGRCFSAQGIQEFPGRFVGGVGLTIIGKNSLTFFARYDVEAIEKSKLNTVQLGVRIIF